MQKKTETSPKSGIFSIRLDQKLLDKLTAAAKERGESRNAYIAKRLESADRAETLQELQKVAMGEKNFALALAISMIVGSIEIQTGGKWDENPFTAEKTKEAINMLLDTIAAKGETKGETVVPDRLKTGFITSENIAQVVVFGLLDQIRRASEPTVKSKRDEAGATHAIGDSMYAAQWIKRWWGKTIVKRIRGA